jgi:hypothetical protein
MDKLRVSQVYADVVNNALAEGDEKDKVARPQFVEGDRLSASKLLFARARQGDPSHFNLKKARNLAAVGEFSKEFGYF